MKNRKDPLGLSATRIEVIKVDRNKDQTTPSDDAQGEFIDTIEGARDIAKEINEKLDDHLGFDPEKINFGDVSLAEHIRVTLGDVLTAIEKVQDLNQALDQADRDRPAGFSGDFLPTI